jgi:C4-dicarboxylate transporter/malic acid transport protein
MNLRTFHAGWPGMALATSGVALTSLVDPWDSIGVDRAIGVALAVIAVVITLLMAGATVARVLRHRDAFFEDLRNPMLGAMLGTAPASVIVLALAIAQLGSLEELPAALAGWSATVMVVAGVLASLVLGMTFFHHVVAHSELPVAMITGVWFIPVVVLVIVPSVTIRVLRLGVGVPEELAIALSVASWGAGMMLFVFLGAVVGWRLITHAPPPAQMVASWAIWLAPAGAGALGLIASTRLIERSSPELSDPFRALAILGATALWGFGLWWLVFTVIQVLRNRRELHFHVGSWGFVFPVAAFAALSAELSTLWDTAIFGVFAATLWVLLLVLWTFLVFKSVRSMVTLAG